MLIARPGLPAHIAFLLNEPFPFDDLARTRKKLREILRELRDQAELACRNWSDIAKGKSDRFVVVMNGGLDLFGQEGACFELRCRIANGEQIARSIALMADEVVMHDFVVEKILGMDARRNESIDSLLADVVLLKIMRPIIERGLIVFEAPVVPICSHCLIEIEQTINRVTTEMYFQFGSDMKVGKYNDGTKFVDTGPLYNPKVYLRGVPSKHKNRDELIKHAIAACVRSTVFDLAIAAHLNGTIFSNSAVGMAAVLACEERFDSPAGLRALDGRRAGSLPWVRGLSIEQTLELRDEAHEALPELREFLASNLGATQTTGDVRGTTEADYIARLREQALAVRSELAVVTSKRSRLAASSLGIASLGISALGICADNIGLAPTALALLGVLGAMRGIDGPHEEHIARQKSRPGYVLVAAQEILQHALD